MPGSDSATTRSAQVAPLAQAAAPDSDPNATLTQATPAALSSSGQVRRSTSPGRVSPAAGSSASSAASSTAGVTRSPLTSRTTVTTTIAVSWATGFTADSGTGRAGPSARGELMRPPAPARRRPAR